MVYSVLGWLGVVVFILAYLLLSLEYLSANKTTYHWLNALGAICLVVNSVSTDDLPSVAVNAIWGLIALLTVVKILSLNKMK